MKTWTTPKVQSLILEAIECLHLSKLPVSEPDGTFCFYETRVPIAFLQDASLISTLSKGTEQKKDSRLGIECFCFSKRYKNISKIIVSLHALHRKDPLTEGNYPLLWIGQCQDCATVYWFWRNR